MNIKNLSLGLSMGACLVVAACSDKSADADAPAAAATPAPAAAAPAADGAVAAAPAATVAPWTGDLATATAEPHCALDALNGTVATADGKLTVASGQPAVIEGWVASSDMRSAPAFSLVLDGASDYQIAGTTGVARDDVAKAYSSDQLATAGFRLDVANLSVPAGDYKIVLAHQENGAWMSCETNHVLTVN